MAETSLTRAGIAEAVHSKVGLSRADSARLVESMLDLIADSLVEGDEVKLTGFGTFTLRDKRARVGRNPRTREAAAISARRVLGFRASQALRDQVAVVSG